MIELPAELSSALQQAAAGGVVTEEVTARGVVGNSCNSCDFITNSWHVQWLPAISAQPRCAPSVPACHLRTRKVSALPCPTLLVQKPTASW